MVMSDLNMVFQGLPEALSQDPGRIPAVEVGAQIAGWMPVTVWKRRQVNKPLFSL